MVNQLVAGTIMMNGTNGEKYFLVSKEADGFNFIMTPIKEELTSLASILDELKTAEIVDVTAVGLVELTNIEVAKKKMPLYVFEIDEEYAIAKENERYVWETPQTLRDVLRKFHISGVPIFE